MVVGAGVSDWVEVWEGQVEVTGLEGQQEQVGEVGEVQQSA